jgi:plastocyanin
MPKAQENLGADTGCYNNSQYDKYHFLGISQYATVFSDRTYTLIKYFMKKKGVFLSVLCLLIVGLAVYSCGKSSSYNSGSGGSGGNPPPTGSVSIVNMSFSSSSITVYVGTTVTWTNNDAMAHTVTSDNNNFDSGNIGPGGKYSRTFSTAGTFPYHCTIHPTMTGTVTVKTY